MNRVRNHYTFSDRHFEDTVAHNGIGTIKTARAADKGEYAGINFIDLTDIPPGHSIGVHRHDNDDQELYVVISGHGRMNLGNTQFPVGPGDVIVNSVGGSHGLTNNGSETIRIVVVDIPVETPSEL